MQKVLAPNVSVDTVIHENKMSSSNLLVSPKSPLRPFKSFSFTIESIIWLELRRIGRSVHCTELGRSVTLSGEQGAVVGINSIHIDREYVSIKDSEGEFHPWSDICEHYGTLAQKKGIIEALLRLEQ